MSREVRRAQGVPTWFTVVLHLWNYRRCRKQGHEGIQVAGGCCTHCGYVWGT